MFDTDIHGNDGDWQDVVLLLQGLADDEDAEARRDLSPALGGHARSIAPRSDEGAPAHDDGLLSADAALRHAFEEALATIASCKATVEHDENLHGSVNAWHDDLRDGIIALDAHMVDVRTGFHALETDLDHARSGVGEHHASARMALEHAASETGHRHTDETQSAFEHLVDALDARCRHVVDGAFNAMDERIAHAFEETEREVERHGSALESGISRLVLESASRISHEALSEVRRGFEDVMRHGIETLAEEAAAQMVSMTAGASITATLTPILPALAAARTVVHAVNSVIDGIFGHD